MKEVYVEDAVPQIKRLLTLLDRNPTSKTYGCFDRNYWHYKIKDFPSGMSQEFVLALALVTQEDFPGNIFFQNEQTKKFVSAALRFMSASSRRDGSTDDYYPYERALGAAVFSLAAGTESYLLLGLKDASLLDFFIRRGKWITAAEESGRLSNHHAIAGLALWNLYSLTGDSHFKKAAEKKIHTVLDWQSKEGWYQEYEGCDPGYLSVSIDFLAQYFQKSKDVQVLESLNRAVNFVYELQYPDGSLSGEVGSRCTNLFAPNGFEILAAGNEKAARIANSFLIAKQSGRLAVVQDDYILGHGLISNLQAYRNALERDYGRGNDVSLQPVSTYFAESGFYLYRQKDLWALLNVKRGGCGRIYKGQDLIYSDSGVLLRHDSQTAVSSFPDTTAEIAIERDGFSVKKPLIRYQQHFATPVLFLIFRMALLLLGPFRWSSQWLRKRLQKKMILGRKRTQSSYERKVSFLSSGIRLQTRVTSPPQGSEALLTNGLVPLYTAVGECFDETSLRSSWTALSSCDDGFFSEELIQ